MGYHMKRWIICPIVLALVCTLIPSYPAEAAIAQLYWPVRNSSGASVIDLSRGYGNGHNGIDIANSAGCGWYAAYGGTVYKVYKGCISNGYNTSGHQSCSPNHGRYHLEATINNTFYSGDYCNNGFGNGVVIQCNINGTQYFMQYAHMNSVADDIYEGLQVDAGKYLGTVGDRGFSFGTHAHFEVNQGTQWGTAINNDYRSAGCQFTYNTDSLHTHSYSSSVTKEATCTAEGLKTYTCSCGDKYTEKIPAKGHSYKDTFISPTMTEKGYTLHVCSVCGDTFKDSYVDIPLLKEDGWYYCKALPSDIDANSYNIEYNNYYEKIQKASPGSDWKKGETVKNEWQNTGNPYESESELPVSDSRVLVRSVYYHFCGPNTGNVGNYAQTGDYVHYDEIEIGKYGVTPYSQGNDEGHTYYLLNWDDGGGQVKCQSGVTCDGSYGSHGERCAVWYKMNTYQDRVKIEQYKYTKNSGWTSTKDSAAKSSEVRFRRKDNPSLKDGTEIQVTEKNLICGITFAKNTVADICSQFPNVDLICKDEKGNLLSRNEILVTGATVHMADSDNDANTYTIVIAGDVFGDGALNLKDVTMVAQYCLSKRTLTDAQLAAADVVADGEVNLKDVTMLARCNLNKATLPSQK